MQLSYPKLFNSKNIPIITNRNMIKKTYLEKGNGYASILATKNCKDLIKILEWNSNNNFHFFRVSSNMFPWSSNYKIKDLNNYFEIKHYLNQASKIINKNKMRITAHPGPFNILASSNTKVINNTIKDLSVHGELFDLMNFSHTVFNKINIHVGATYGDKKNSLKTFCKNFKQLPYNVQTRLTIENDDRSSMYSINDLYHGVYEEIGIPLVFDYHHHKFCSGNLSEQKALELAISTWPQNIKPVVHYSESRLVEKNDNNIKPQAHSDYIYNKINTYGYNLDVMVEAKHKELAVIKYKETYLNEN